MRCARIQLVSFLALSVLNLPLGQKWTVGVGLIKETRLLATFFLTVISQVQELGAGAHHLGGLEGEPRPTASGKCHPRRKGHTFHRLDTIPFTQLLSLFCYLFIALICIRLCLDTVNTCRDTQRILFIDLHLNRDQKQIYLQCRRPPKSKNKGPF